MPLQKLKDFLNSRGVKYVVLSHSPAFTAQEVAESADISGRELAKTVMVRLDGEMAMAVVPASKMVDFDLLAETAGAEKVELASENQFKDLFPGCEVGAMPPFGNLYGMAVYAAAELSEDEEIAFSAGNHSELIRLGWRDYRDSVEPTVAAITQQV